LLGLDFLNEYLSTLRLSFSELPLLQPPKRLVAPELLLGRAAVLLKHPTIKGTAYVIDSKTKRRMTPEKESNRMGLVRFADGAESVAKKWNAQQQFFPVSIES
jgi:hypothetical protein